VQKIHHTRLVLSKVLLTAVLGVLFFVQAQASFIYCAYDKDYPPIAASHSHLKQDSSGKTHITDAQECHHASKLNKRYQLVTPHAMLPAGVSIAASFCTVRNQWLIPPVLASTHFLYIKPLRGPPFV